MIKNQMLALVSDAFGGRGGIAQYNRDLISSLSEQGANITVLPRVVEDPHELPNGVKQEPARTCRVSYLLAATRLALFQQFNIIFCGHLNLAPLAASLARATHTKYIVQIHGIEAWKTPSKARRYAVEQADRVLAVSRHTRSAILSWAAMPPEKVVVLPNTVDRSFSPGSGDLMRDKLGLKEAKTLLSVGRLEANERYKGHDRVIALMPDLIRVFDGEIVYLIAGHGSDRGRLETLVADLGVQQHVRFLGSVQPGDLPDLYRASDLFVMPSSGEGFGIVFLEAMACGTPVVGTPLGGASDALGDGMLGALATPEQLLESIVEGLKAPTYFRDAIAGRVQERFGRHLFALKAKQIIESVLSP